MANNPRFHPVLQTLACMVLMALIKKAFPWATLDAAWLSKAAFVLLGIGITLGVLGGGKLERSRTTTDPLKLDQAKALVTGGIYRFTRNPMYLGFVFILAALALFLKNPLALATIPVYLLSMTWLQIIPEERALQRQFPGAFPAYKAKVRRWI